MALKYISTSGGGASIPEHLEKIRLRLWTCGFWRQQTVLDLFAGMGYLSKEYAEAGCERLICVEKDPEYFKVLEDRMKSLSNVELVQADNIGFLDDVASIRDVSFVDFDAFGCPNQQIAKFFEKYPVERAMMVNVTDGTLLNLNRLASIDLEEHYLVNLYSKGRLSRRDFDSKRGLRRLLPWLQRTFINLLAAKYGFSTSFVYHAMNREANVVYYCFIAYPDCEVELPWASGQSPVLRFRSDEEVRVKTLRKFVERRRL